MNNDKHPITDRLLDLIKNAIQDVRGSKAAFCRQCGITPYNLSKILKGDRKFVFGDMWDKFCDYFPEIDDRPAYKRQPSQRDMHWKIIKECWGQLSNAERGQLAGMAQDMVLAKKGTTPSA